jgi:hypothetical protein
MAFRPSKAHFCAACWRASGLRGAFFGLGPLTTMSSIFRSQTASTTRSILALKRDGETLSRRDKGPIWIVYPRDDFPELQLETINARWVWQLIELEVW